MRRRRSRLARYVLLLLVVIIGGALALRWQAREAALTYGRIVQQALFEQEEAAAKPGAKPRKRDLFEEPEMRQAMATMGAWWNPLGLDYVGRAEELRTGLVYLHIQLNLPMAERFRRPPRLRHFTLDPGDKTDGAVRRALRTLLDDYMDYAGTR
jgi:hypothetical protein